MNVAIKIYQKLLMKFKAFEQKCSIVQAESNTLVRMQVWLDIWY